MNSSAQVKQEILQKLDCGLDFSDGQVRRLIDERLCRSDCIGRLDVAERRKLGRELFAAIRGFDVLQELLEGQADYGDYGQWAGSDFYRKGRQAYAVAGTV